MSTLETVKVVLVTHISGKPPLLAIDAGRRLVQLNIKPSFAQLETWIGELTSGRRATDRDPDASDTPNPGRRKTDRAGA